MAEISDNISNGDKEYNDAVNLINNKNYDEDYNPRFRKQRKKVCVFCGEKNGTIDYKDVNKLKRYVSERGKILPRRITGNCAKHQRALTVEIKKARHIAIMPYVTD